MTVAPSKRMLVKDRPPSYATLEDLIVAATEAVEPPERLTISEAAVKYVKIKEKNYSGPWSPEKTPYLVEPQDCLTSLDYQGMCFVGPARTGKSQMWLNWMSHSAMCDPADMMLLQMSQPRARQFSLGDLRKHFRASEDVAKKLLPGRQNDNVYDKTFVSGMRVTIVHPSINELSGKTSGRNWAMDYDRLPKSIDGEGNAWVLLSKRAETLGRYGMTVVESSPGFDVTNVKWIPEAPHEAPPCEGILSIYNTGDRRRWFWRCLQCRDSFEPDFHLFNIPESRDRREAAEAATLGCPHCGFPMKFEMRQELNATGRWIKEGEIWLPDGTITGTPRRSDVASFWLKGAAAAFNTWTKLILSVLNARDELERTGSEETLQAVTNTSLGLPYTPKALEAGKLPEELKRRAQPYNERGVVPPGVRFLITTIDVQKRGFVLHTFGIAPVQMEGGAWTFDIYHVDMWKETKSKRLDDDGHPRSIDPASYKEDWHILIKSAIERTYPLGDGSGRRMQVKLLACDSGGAASTTAARLNKALDGPTLSVTANAYDFWRFLRDDPQGRSYHNRFHLLKGEPSHSRPPLEWTNPDSQQKDKYAIARGDVPVWAVNSNKVKDQVDILLGRDTPGGQIHFPVWYDDAGNREDIDWLFTQLTAETRLPAGWKNIARKKNEAFDLLAYCIAFLKHPSIRIESNLSFWITPPAWADEWDRNDLVFTPTPEGKMPPPATVSERSTLADLGSALG